jgi:serine/threonine protein phosphatase PrpC
MSTENLIINKYVIGRASIQGDNRRVFEDRSLVKVINTARNLKLIVAVVADGVGSSEGSVSARIAVETVLNSIETSTEQQIPDLITQAITDANTAVYQDNLRNDKESYTTLVVGVVFDDRFYVGNVGDSRAYWLPGSKKIRQLTLDHTYANIYGVVKDSGEGSAVVNYIGGNPEIDIDFGFYLKNDKDGEDASELGLSGLPLQPGDAILLCSDGLIKKGPNGNPYATDEEIIETFNSEIEPNSAAIRLTSYPKSRRVTDNVTAITIQYLSADQQKGFALPSAKPRFTKYLAISGAAVLVILLSILNVAQSIRIKDLEKGPAVVLITTTPEARATAQITIQTAELISTPDTSMLEGTVLLEVSDGTVYLINDGFEELAPMEMAISNNQLLRVGSYLTKINLSCTNSSASTVNFAPETKYEILFEEEFALRLANNWIHILQNLYEQKIYVSIDDAVYLKDGHMIIEIRDDAAQVYCFSGRCRIENGAGEGIRILPGYSLTYYLGDHVYGDPYIISEEERLNWNFQCDNCLGSILLTPIPTPLPPTATATHTRIVVTIVSPSDTPAAPSDNSNQPPPSVNTETPEVIPTEEPTVPLQPTSTAMPMVTPTQAPTEPPPPINTPTPVVPTGGTTTEPPPSDPGTEASPTP